jgi:sensor histidine kinase YesM
MFINLIQNSVNYKKEDVQLNISVSSMTNLTNPDSGIGLANCKRIAMSHKGYISVVSKIGEGTVFKVFLLVTESTNNKNIF